MEKGYLVTIVQQGNWKRNTLIENEKENYANQLLIS